MELYYEGILKCLLYFHRRFYGNILFSRVRLMKLMFLSSYNRADDDLVIRYAPSSVRLDYEILYRGPFSKTVSDKIQEFIGKNIEEDVIDVGFEHPLYVYFLNNVDKRTYRDGFSKLRSVFLISISETYEENLKKLININDNNLRIIIQKLANKITNHVIKRVRTVVRSYGYLDSRSLENLSLSIVGISAEDKGEYLRMNIEDVMKVLNTRIVPIEKVFLSKKYLESLLKQN